MLAQWLTGCPQALELAAQQVYNANSQKNFRAILKPIFFNLAYQPYLVVQPDIMYFRFLM